MAKNSPFLFFKNPEEDTLVQADLTSRLQPGETITSIAVGSVTPASDTALQVTNTTGALPLVVLKLVGGDNGVSYGAPLTITTNTRVLLAQVVVTVAQDEFVPYTTSNPDAFQDLVDSIEAGSAAVGTSIFTFPPQVDPVGGFVTWELMDSEGTVYAGGNAYDYKVRSNGISNTVIAKSVVNIPVSVPPSLEGQRYQLRYILELPQQDGLPVDPLQNAIAQSTFFQFENIQVIGLNTVPLGTQPSVEMQGVPATVSIVVDKPYDNLTVELWSGGQQVTAPTKIAGGERTANGWYFAGVINTAQMGVSLIPYQLVWKYWASNNAANVYQESADFWVVNPSIMSAVSDVRAKVSKARATLYGAPDMLYTNPTLLTWLRRGMDTFNAWGGVFTSFTMTNALGPIREYWLMCAEVAALESQYLAEGEKAFNFQGAAISLDVDRTQYLDSAASKIQARLDNELKPIKQNLIIKGNQGGDGSADPAKLQRGAIGSVGISITQANMWGRLGPGYLGGRY